MGEGWGAPVSLKNSFGSKRKGFRLHYLHYEQKTKMSGALLCKPVFLREILFRFQTKWFLLTFSPFRTKMKMSAAPQSGWRGLGSRVHEGAGESRKTSVMLNNKPKYGITTNLSHVGI
jgi:hypothetical protein